MSLGKRYDEWHGRVFGEGQRTMRRYSWERVTRQLEELLVLAAKRKRD